MTKTSHLNNEFRIIAGCKVTIDNSTTTVCNSQGGLLSLNDYESNSDIEKCIADDCDYQLSLSIVMKKGDYSIDLTLSTLYKGKTMRYEQSLLSFKIFVERGNPIEFSP